MRFPLIKSLISLFAAISCVSIIWGQSVYWSPSSGTLQQGKSNAIDLFFDSCQPDGEPEIPKMPGLELRFRGQSQSTNIINGRRSSKTILNYQATPLRLGTVTLPSIRVKTSDGEKQVPAARFEVVEATVGNTGISPDDVFVSIFQNRDEKIYAGEVFELEYIAGAKQEYQLADLSVPEWSPTEIVTGGLVDGQVTQVNYKGAAYLVKLYTAKAIATEPGIKQLPPARQDATVVVGRRRNIFQEAVYDAFTIESDPFALEVLPLPEGAPASFTGAVGQFQLESRVVPAEVQVGEPVTWTLELSGSGNWPAGIGVPARSVSSRFKAIQPETKNEFSKDDLFTGSQSEDIVLIPTEAGSFEFGPLEYTYFDPKEERYKTINIPAQTVTVTPPAPNNPALSSGAQTGDEGNNDTPSYDQPSYDLSPTGNNTFEKKPELLKDPLSSESEGQVPSQKIGLALPTAIAATAPFALWISLAFLRSIVTDPRKAERKALRQLRKISRSALPSEPEKLKQLHLEWRAAASQYFALSAVEPTPDEIYNSALAMRGDDFAKNWKQAWQLSDQALFGVNESNQQEWQNVQKQAVGMCPGKHYSPGLLIRSKAWLPALSVLAILSFATVDTKAQDAEETATDLYQQGNFAAAAAKWTAAVNEAPQVSEYRYNAGLAYAQTGDWARAWGYWTSAYCLDPTNKAIAWNLRIAHQNTSAYDPVLDSLITGKGLHRAVKLRSPAGWQALSIYAIWGLGGCLALAVIVLYLRPIRRSSRYFIVLAVLCGLFAYFCQWAHSKYEALGEPDTILVVSESPLFSIPTDLQADQVSTTVSEGTVVKQERSFLGWTKIQLPNGESGWLRRENLMPLYGQSLQN